MIRITDSNDPRIAAYRNIRERDLVRRDGLFVADASALPGVPAVDPYLQVIRQAERLTPGFLAP